MADSRGIRRALRALIDWSYDILTEDEKRLVRMLSVFSGGWTLEAAETLLQLTLADNSANLDAIDFSPRLGKVAYSPRDLRTGPRYRMLETIKELCRP